MLGLAMTIFFSSWSIIIYPSKWWMLTAFLAFSGIGQIGLAFEKPSEPDKNIGAKPQATQYIERKEILI